MQPRFAKPPSALSPSPSAGREKTRRKRYLRSRCTIRPEKLYVSGVGWVEADRLTKVETLLGVVIENQESSKDRQYRSANELITIANRQLALEAKIDETNKLIPRVTSLEQTRSQVLTGYQIVKWMLWIIGGFFTLSLAIGEKLVSMWKML